MLKDSLKIVIREFHETELPELIPRHLSIDHSIFHSRINKIITIIGARRAGKTTFLFQIMKELIESGREITDFIYINFEDERLMPLRSEELQLILDAYYELYDASGHPLIFLDEVQNVDGWDKFVRRLNDRGYNIFIAGSNSKMLGREIATALRGRTIIHEIFPFSFSEYLSAKQIEIEKNFLYSKKRHQIRQFFDMYSFGGGYPEIALIDDKITQTRILQDYFNTVFYRDLVERNKIKNRDLLQLWLKTLMVNISSMISLSKAENDFKSRGIRLSKASLSAYAGYVEDVFFGFFVPLYTQSERKRQVNPKKFYLIDPGLHNLLTLKYSENKGRLLENIVFLEIRRKGKQVSYFKSKRGYEIDFIVDEHGEKTLIQVCHDLSHIDTFNREKRALLEGMKVFDLDSGLILTFDDKRIETIGGHRINIIPVWEWLLGNSL